MNGAKQSSESFSALNSDIIVENEYQKKFSQIETDKIERVRERKKMCGIYFYFRLSTESLCIVCGAHEH